MDPVAVVLTGVCLTALLAVLLDASGRLPPGVRVTGPLVTVSTGRGRAVLNALARVVPAWVWRAWSNAGVVVALAGVTSAFVGLVTAAAYVLLRPHHPAEPADALVVPGVNEFIPLSVVPEVLLGLFVALAVHEAGHGVLCRVEGINVDSVGMFLVGVVPLGAFVEPEQRSASVAPAAARARVYAAGVANNAVLAVVAFALLAGPVAGSFAVVEGVHVSGVAPGTPAAAAGLDRGDVLQSVDGRSISGPQGLSGVLSGGGNDTTLGLADGSRIRLTGGLPVAAAASGLPVSSNTSVVSVNGTTVASAEELRAAVANRSWVRLNTSNKSVVLPAGARVESVNPDGPLAAAGAPAGASGFVLSVGGNRTPDGAALAAVLADVNGTMTVRAAFGDGIRTYRVRLAEGGDPLGCEYAAGPLGIQTATLGVQQYPAREVLGTLGGGTRGVVAGGPLRRVFAVVMLPLADDVGLARTSFDGFTGPIRDFYTVEGPLGMLGEWAFELANALYWIGWANLTLAAFNLLPMLPLDGGRLLRAVADGGTELLPGANQGLVARTFTVAVTGATLAALLVVLIVPSL